MAASAESQRPLGAGRHVFALVLAALLGGAVWVTISITSVHAEAFDDQAYFTVGLPVIALGCLLLGHVVPYKAWRYGLVAIGTHAVALIVLVVQTGAAGLVAVGLGFFALIAVPMILAGWLGAWLRLRDQQGR